jgi:cysteinyl-tRNA synthetase
MKLYNTLTRQKENFVPIQKDRVGLYSCGPTVYDFPHIGNHRANIFADTLKRWLEYNGYKVKHVMNITDVGHLVSDEDEGEDKLEKGAKRDNITAFKVAEKYTKAFMNDLEKLNIERADVYPKATDHVKEQIDLIKILESKGFTYDIKDGIYFDTSKLPDYGKLARLDVSGLREGARVESNPEKRNATDFALWKYSPRNSKRDMEWDSPWGKGFPGWHIECSAMSTKYLGEYFDIHSGGVDHIPVHHTNEIAQSEAAFGKPFVKYWIHSEFLQVNGRKMSKSLNNFYTLDDIEKKYGAEPLAFRLLCLMSYYRDKLNFTDESIISAQKTLNNIRDFIVRMKQIGADGESPKVEGLIIRADKDFKEALSDDINTPRAMAVLFDFIKKMNKFVTQGLGKNGSEKALNFLFEADKVLGLELNKVTATTGNKKLNTFLKERDTARESKDWAESDRIRDEIRSFGFDVEDTPGGQVLKKL